MQADGLPLTRRSIVERAKPKSSPLHRYFDWDDSVAGRRWRLHQAGNLIISVRTVEVSTDKMAREFLSVVDDRRAPAKQYTQRDQVLSKKALRAQVSAQLWARMEQVISQAVALGLDRSEPRWKRAASLVRAR